MDEAKLVEKLSRIEALFQGATTPGEKEAAANARERILNRLRAIEQSDPPIEYRFSMEHRWSRHLFIALLRRYGLNPYRLHGQRYTTVMCRVSKRFVDETLWPQFQELSNELDAYLQDVTNRVIAKAVHSDVSEPVVRVQHALPE